MMAKVVYLTGSAISASRHLGLPFSLRVMGITMVRLFTAGIQAMVLYGLGGLPAMLIITYTGLVNLQLTCHRESYFSAL
jgi:hypothetical protein